MTMVTIDSPRCTGPVGDDGFPTLHTAVCEDEQAVLGRTGRMLEGAVGDGPCSGYEPDQHKSASRQQKSSGQIVIRRAEQ